MEAASAEYGIDRSKLVAVGYSNGANVAASTILLHPGLLKAAVLFRAMVPFEPDLTPDLSGMPVFLAAGRMDRMIPPDNTQRLADILDEAGADVDLRWRDTGHPLTYEEVGEAKVALGSPTKALYSPRRRAVITYPGGQVAEDARIFLERPEEVRAQFAK